MPGSGVDPNTGRQKRQDARPPATFQQRVLAGLTDPHWYWALIPAGIGAFLLGFWGYGSYEGGENSISDAVYGAGKLFFLHAAPAPESHVGIPLDIARFLAPVVAGWAALIAVVALFRERVQQLLIPLKRGHVVVCGLGYVGFEFVRKLRNEGYRVVAIEADAANPRIKTCRDWGYPVVIGDAQLPSTLQAAGLRRAARLLAVTPGSVVNTEIVMRARQLVDKVGRHGLRCLARIDDPGLCVLLRIEESNRGADESVLDFFSTDEISARLLLDQHPVNIGGRPHILVAHIDTLGAGLIFHAARRWHDERADAAAALSVTVVDGHAEEQVSSLLARYPALEQVCEFRCYSASISGIDRLATVDRAARADGTTEPPLTCAYVTANRDERTVETALNLRYALDPKVPVVAALSRAYGVAELLECDNTPGGTGLTVFKTLQETCDVELVEGGSFEAVAHEIHRRYCRMQPADATPPSPWSTLDDALKESSRAQARHIGVKLRSIGCVVTPLRHWHAKDFRFTDHELERLGLMEHDRWMQEKIAAGWTLGAEDKKLKKDPHLVPMAELPPDIAEVDRNFVRAIPEMLAAVGLQIVDVQRTAPRYPTSSG